MSPTLIICLCVCVSLVMAIPIQSRLDASESVKQTTKIDTELKMEMPLDEKGMIEPVKLKEIASVKSDMIKKRIERSVMPKVCSKGEIRIGGVCMSCADLDLEDC